MSGRINAVRKFSPVNKRQKTWVFDAVINAPDNNFINDTLKNISAKFGQRFILFQHTPKIYDVLIIMT